MSESKHLDNLYFYAHLGKWKPDPSAIYGFHLSNVLSELAALLGDDYYRFRFVVYEHKMHLPFPEFKMSGDDVILIMLSDEDSKVPLELCDRFFAIIKAYYPLEENVRNILAFPIGYSNSASLTRFIPFADRNYDASYAGNFLSNRLDFYRQFNLWRFLPPFQIRSHRIRTSFFKLLTRLKLYRPQMYRDTFGKSLCFWSGGFAKGLSRDEYAEVISNTRIALCPMGFRSTECFRLMETMRLGCAIVSDKLPPSRWYKDSPIIVERDWLHIRKTVRRLLADPAALEDLHRKTLEWWDKICSDEAVASYLADELRRLMNDAENKR